MYPSRGELDSILRCVSSPRFLSFPQNGPQRLRMDCNSPEDRICLWIFLTFYKSQSPYENSFYQEGKRKANLQNEAEVREQVRRRWLPPPRLLVWAGGQDPAASQRIHVPLE